MNFLQLIHSDTYNFLREDEHLGSNIIYLTTGGSHAYGTNVEGSDVDLRGVSLDRVHEWIGFTKFDKPFEHKETDTVIYGFRKMVELLCECNPNVVELFGTEEKHIFVCNWVGKELRDNIDFFLTQRAARSFGGYATHQLRRIQNALARDSYPNEEKQRHILRSIENMLTHLREAYHDFSDEEILFYLDVSDQDPDEKELFVDWNLKRFPLRDLKNIMSEVTNVVRDYGKLTGRNKKEEWKLSKHAMHLVRLLLTGTEILQGNGVRTNRLGTEEHSFLMDIRNEVVPLDRDFFLYVDDLEKEFQYAYTNSPLPEMVDMKKVEDFVIEVGKSVVGRS